ncbi:sorbose reductase [Geosmithia morbida]|uniref:Sorbose reductase n=1 Tax=Geosmithia morbida TaxID=1094350 RepID=A0A9P5D761_9HYPO|nr:sorbose reductase [Geosmithia morbida]KAF4125465.1 sorbose reductase [Geosmithia morbida]
MVLAAHPDPATPVLSHFSLEGKSAFVTGASRGIGLAVARGLLEAGASVAITYSTTPDSEVSDLVSSLSSDNPGRVVRAYQCNVTDRAAVNDAVRKAAADIGGGSLDIVVANAGIGDHVAAEDYPEDRFLNMLDVNFNGAFWTAQAAANIMKGSKTRGSIIFTASVSAILVNVPQKQSAYNASKAAVVHLAKSLAVEWADFARVNCVSPGYIATDMLDVHPKEWKDKWFSMIPGQRLCEPEELKGSYVFLASDASSYMMGKEIPRRDRSTS